MEPNATLFIQIINFLIIYRVLKKFLFEHIVKAVLDEDNLLAQLNHKIEEAKSSLIDRERQLESEWVLYHSNFAHVVPDVLTKHHTSNPCRPTTNTCVVLTDDEKMLISKHLLEKLIQKVTRVH